jgi:hypothetical protein
MLPYSNVYKKLQEADAEDRRRDPATKIEATFRDRRREMHIRHERAELDISHRHEVERLHKAASRGGDMSTALLPPDRQKQLDERRAMTAKHVKERANLADWRENSLKRIAEAKGAPKNAAPPPSQNPSRGPAQPPARQHVHEGFGAPPTGAKRAPQRWTPRGR